MPEKYKVIDIIKKEIALEDDMIALYTQIIKEEAIFKALKGNDKDTANEIINILLRDTKKHIQTMGDIIKRL